MLFLRRRMPIKIGVVFGGGGTRGLGHVGAIKAFEEFGLKPHFICGTSIGSLIGAAWASGRSAKEMEKLALEIKKSDIRPNKIIPTPASAKHIEEFAAKAMGADKMFSELKTPFACVATDINSGQETVIESGFVAKAVSASCAVPGFFAPVLIEGKNYVDGGVVNNIPTSVAKSKHCDYIIAIDINSSRGNGSETTKMFDVIAASIRIMGVASSLKGYVDADYIIKPDLKKFKATKIKDNEELIEIGYLAAKKAMPEILKAISSIKPRDKRIKEKIIRLKQELKKERNEYRKARRKK